MPSPCPGCGIEYPPFDGPVHPYIGANPGCWAIYGALLAGEPADATVVRGMVLTLPPLDVGRETDQEGAASLLVDAYAAQHHGDDSPQAVQSVGVHLLALHAVLERGEPADRALWVRRRALRRRGVFHKLVPPPLGSALGVGHLVVQGGSGGTFNTGQYVASVYRAWASRHAEVIADWYAEFVLAD